MDVNIRQRKTAKNNGKSPKKSKQSDRTSDSNNHYLSNHDKDSESYNPLSTHRDEGDGESVSEMPIEENLLKKDVLSNRVTLSLEFDAVALTLFFFALGSRFYKLEEPRHIVFDELHYGKYVSLYMRRTFFFDLHPPLGKQLIALVTYLTGFDGNVKFDKIGSMYPEDVPVFAMRFMPALCGSLIVPLSYYLMMELGCKQWTAALGALLLLFDNAMLTQSRFILMEPILLFFLLLGFVFLMKFRKVNNYVGMWEWWIYLTLAVVNLTLAMCVKYSGFFACCLGLWIIWRDYWSLIGDRSLSDRALMYQGICRSVVVTVVAVVTYVSIFYVHLSLLTKAGPHDNVMTSAFQASLEGGLASITKGQPLEVAHGSQVTLRHTHGRACWLHSHLNVYPIKYPDKRGSSHQQQVTCYSFKDVNNWWIVKRPEKKNLMVSQPVDVIKHGDIIQLVHGITSRSLNSHDVSAPVSPHNQEVSCYIDYNVSMPAQIYWKVDIINRGQVGDVWHTIESMVRLIHVNSSQALKFSGRQLPDWGYNQFEIVTDSNIKQDDTIWNVEEHRYTKSEDEKEREQEMVNAEMIPLRATSLSFWTKFFELQYKMMFPSQENVQNHMYSSEPLEWPLMTRGIAYWVSSEHNGQVHLLGNVVVWYSGTIGLVMYFSLVTFYLLRRRRMCFDVSPGEWCRFVQFGEVLFGGFLLHFVPYFFMDRTLFMHHYLPAFVFKVLLTVAVIDHISVLVRKAWLRAILNLLVLGWVLSVVIVFRKFSVLSYGTTALSAEDVLRLRWKETWDFIIHK